MAGIRNRSYKLVICVANTSEYIEKNQTCSRLLLHKKIDDTWMHFYHLITSTNISQLQSPGYQPFKIKKDVFQLQTAFEIGTHITSCEHVLAGKHEGISVN